MKDFNPHTTRKHFLSSSDPRLKVLSALALLIMVISCKGVGFPVVVAALCVALSLFMGFRPRSIGVRFVEPGFIMLILVLLKLFFTGHSILFSFDLFGLPIVGHWDGLLEGLRISSRIAGAVAVVTVLSLATPFTEMMAALAWFRVPQGFIDIALFAWRYLFLLSDDAKVIYDAQKNRLGYTGYRQGLRSFGSLAGCLVIKAFDNSRNVTTAMVQRGYDGTMPLLKHKPFRAAELIWSLLFIALMGAMWQSL